MTIDWFTFAAQVVNFLVLVFLLKRFLYAPITNAMQEREDRISERLNEAAERKLEAERLAAEYQEKAASLETQRHGMLDQAKQEVDEKRKLLLAQVKQDADHHRQEWQATLEKSRATLLQTIRQRCNDQVMAATRRAINELADADLETQLIKTFLAKLDAHESSVQESRVATPVYPDDEDSIRGDSSNQPTEARIYTAFKLSSAAKEELTKELRRRLSVSHIHFHSEPEIVCGMEVHVGDQKIGWSVDEFLSSLRDELDRLLEKPL